MFKIYDNRMNEIPYPDGVKPLDIFISSIEKERNAVKVEGANGLVDYGSTFKERNIELEIMLVTNDTQDYRLLRDSVNYMFQVTDTLKVSETYEPGKIYEIAVDESFIPERIEGNQRYANATISCKTVNLPFARSIGTTADIDKGGLTTNSNLWAFGMGLISDEDSFKYTHTGTSFRIYNAGNFSVNPFEMDLKITITDVKGSYSFFEITNVTNGTKFRIDEEVKESQKVIIDGPIITINGLQSLRKTNKQFIGISPGWNYFIIKGANNAKVSFDFPFYYL